MSRQYLRPVPGDPDYELWEELVLLPRPFPMPCQFCEQNNPDAPMELCTDHFHGCYPLPWTRRQVGQGVFPRDENNPPAPAPLPTPPDLAHMRSVRDQVCDFYREHPLPPRDRYKVNSLRDSISVPTRPPTAGTHVNVIPAGSEQSKLGRPRPRTPPRPPLRRQPRGQFGGGDTHHQRHRDDDHRQETPRPWTAQDQWDWDHRDDVNK